MKKKIFISLFIVSLCFILGGFYIHKSIEGVNSKLEEIITLQHVEMLREKMLNTITVVQSDLLLKDSPYTRKLDVFVWHVEKMDQATAACFDCHHTEKTKEKLNFLVAEVEDYKQKLSRVYTIRANQERLFKEKANALEKGKQLILEINNLTVSASLKSTHRIELARREIAETKQLLRILVTIGPLIVLAITLFFIKHFTGSVTVLINATRKIKEGNLQFRITEKLKDEFQELATAFNEMAGSLKDQCSKMQHAERLAVVGELAAGLAHEVRNPLTGIKVSYQLLLGELPSGAKNREVYSEAINEIDRIEELLTSLLNYARPPKPNFYPVNINNVLKIALKRAQYSLKSSSHPTKNGKDIKLVKDLDEQIPEIEADSSQLQQVFLNLFLNAMDAITNKGVIKAKTSMEQGGFVQVTISDTGLGIEEEKIGQIFEPFFTTKSKGTGLGLAICKRLIEQQKGHITVYNNPEKGVTFCVKFPVQKVLEAAG